MYAIAAVLQFHSVSAPRGIYAAVAAAKDAFVSAAAARAASGTSVSNISKCICV